MKLDQFRKDEEALRQLNTFSVIFFLLITDAIGWTLFIVLYIATQK